MSNKIAKKPNAKKVDTSGREIAVSVIEYVVAVLGVALCVLVPLYLKNGYHGVGDCKFEMYKVLMIIGTILLALITILYFCQGGIFVKSKMMLTDWFMLAFLFFTLLSALVGGNFVACIKGYNGWFMGILSMCSFAVLYFYFSRAGRYYKAVLVALFATAFIAFSVGVLHRMLIDPIGTYGLGTPAEIADAYKTQFLSTLGQSSWYSSFVCTVLPLVLAVFWFSKKLVVRILSGIVSFVGCMTLVTQNSDSAYMAMLGFFFVLFWFSAVDAHRAERFCELLVLFFGATLMMRFCFWIHPNPVLDLDVLSNFMVTSNWMSVGMIVSVLLWLAAIYCEEKSKYPVAVMKIVRLTLLAIIVFAILFAVVILSLSAKEKVPLGLLAFTEKIPYMTWSEKWGNGRGKTWAFTAQMFKDMSIWNKLFGVGPDGYAPYAYKLYANRLEEMWGARTLTNAHNEWFNAVINYGLIGAASYIGIFVSAIWTFVKNQKNNPIMVGFAASVVSYMCHNFFCYQTVCCTPFVFIFIGMGIYLSHKNNMEMSGE